jgi:hypothetical protein
LTRTKTTRRGSNGSHGKTRTPAGRTRDALTAREQVFVRLVHTTDNKTQAYLDAGYRCSRETAAANAHRLLGKARVQQALAALAAERVERLDQNGDEELELLGAVMRFNALDLYDAAGKRLPIPKLPRHVAVAIKSIRQTRDGLVLLEFHDKLRAAELRLRAFGRFTDKVLHSGTVTLEQALSASRASDA